jgi:DNA-binding response OmpR family regulator
VDKPAVLLVDDDEAACTLVTAILDRDFSVDVASDDGEAIEKIRRGRYVAILIDQHDELRLLEFLQANRPELVRRVLVLTASLAKSEMERLRQFAVFGIISKPFEVDLLLGAVKECVGGRSPRTTLLSGSMLFLLADLLRQRLM